MIPVLEAVPNLSSGRDPSLVEEAVRRAERCGVEVVDRGSDPDHNRSVLTLFGAPHRVEEATIALAHLAREAIDLREHRGVHPRVGALDVLPFVPLGGLTLAQARESAHRVGSRIASEVGVPVWFYAAASTPPGRSLAELRRGGFEALARELPDHRAPDLLPPEWTVPRVHPTAGGVCVGARPLLLAWNLDVEGVGGDVLARMAHDLRGRNGGVPGLRVLALELPTQGRHQLSMNLENAREQRPFEVFQAIEARVRAAGGEVVRTEIIGVAPDELLEAAGADRLRTLDRTPPPALSSLLARHVSRRVADALEAVMKEARSSATPLPAGLHRALAALERELMNPPQREPVE